MQRNYSDTNKFKNKSKLSASVITNTINTNTHKTQDVTSAPATSDNNQESNTVDKNKRIRSPNNTTSPLTKKTNEFSSPNHYTLLNTDEHNLDIVINTEINESTPPPPIFLTSPINFTLCKNLE